MINIAQSGGNRNVAYRKRKSTCKKKTRTKGIPRLLWYGILNQIEVKFKKKKERAGKFNRKGRYYGENTQSDNVIKFQQSVVKDVKQLLLTCFFACLIIKGKTIESQKKIKKEEI